MHPARLHAAISAARIAMLGRCCARVCLAVFLPVLCCLIDASCCRRGYPRLHARTDETVRNMSRRVDDIWKALKASTAPRDSRASGRSSGVLCPRLSLEALSESRHPNAMCGRELQNTSKLASNKQGADGAFTQRDLNCLSDPDRNERRQAIEKLNMLIASSMPENRSRDVAHILESEALRRKLIIMLSDPSDNCREIVTDVIRNLLLATPEDHDFISQALEGLKNRMGIGQSCPLEESEEIRLKISILTSTIMVAKASTSGESAVQDIAAILSRCLDDSFHETKKSACTGITALSHKSRRDDLTSVCALIVKSLVDLVRHPHSRVRAAGLQALTALGEKARFSIELLTSKVLPALRMAAVDKSIDLRVATYHACASWLVQDVQSASGGGLVPHLLPILLLGVTDSSTEAAIDTVASLSQVGQAFCGHTTVGCERICDDAVSFEEVDAEGTGREAAAAASLPSPLNKRAPAALREMINAQLMNLLPAALHDLKEWTTSLRTTASRSLYSILALAENRMTNYLDRILPCLCQAVGDEHEAVTVWIIHCMYSIGTFCEVHHWMPLMLEYVSTLRGQPNATVCALVTLSSLARAAGRACRQPTQEHLKQMAEWLASEEVRSLPHAQLQRQLVVVVANIIELAGPAVEPVGERLFHILMHLRGHGSDEYTQELTEQSQQKLALFCGLASVSELAGLHAYSLVSSMLQHSQQWTSDHPDMSSLASILHACPGEILAAMGKPLCDGFSRVTRDHERDPALRMELLRSIDGVLENDAQGYVFCQGHGYLVIETVILPPLIWRAGKSAAAVRYSALHALYTLLSKRRMEASALVPALSSQGQLLPLLCQSMDEDWYADTRKLACYTTAALLELAGNRFTDEIRRQLYPELTKRMDDSSNAVRVTAAAAVQAFAKHALPSAYCDTNTRYFVAAFLLHLDDPDNDVQSAVLRALQAVKLHKSKVLQSEIQKVYNDFRNKHLLDLLRSSS
eukprot:jgi/Ulvmu1/10595/UM065_0049.1